MIPNSKTTMMQFIQLLTYILKTMLSPYKEIRRENRGHPIVIYFSLNFSDIRKSNSNSNNSSNKSTLNTTPTHMILNRNNVNNINSRNNYVT